ncbi:type I methionyl aminopeptidase [Candidatus Dependentiae bacterium]|nr:type I methionyl aminopeptidase [Candidatus Dependentiae bacterium]
MIVIKNKAAIDKMHMAGQLLAGIMAEMSDRIEVGVSTLELDRLIEEKMRRAGLFPVCKGYGGYKYATCISLNDVVIHGVPSDKNILKIGDFVKIDVAGSYKHYCADMTRSFFVGKVGTVVKRLAAAAQWALDCAIKEIAPGKHLSDISVVIQKEVERDGFGVVRTFAGHGIGRGLHEDPEVPNFGKPGEGPLLREGMTLAIEPMITEHGHEVVTARDGWSIKTVDGGLAAHVEDTVVVLRDGAQVLTRI